MPTPLPPARLRALVDHSQDIVLLLGADSRILYESPSVERILGFAPEERIGRSAFELIHPDDLPAAVGLLGELAAAPGRTAAITCRFRARGGDWRHLEAVGKSLVDDAEVGGFVVSCRDLTERVRAEQEVRAAREAAERADRAKSDFLSRMSHELRTPLNAVLGFAQLLESELADPEQRDSAAQIGRAGRHLLSLVDDVLDLAAIEAGHVTLELEPVSLEEVLAEALDLVRLAARERGVRVRVAEAPPAWLLADRRRLLQALLNLLSNAVKYDRPGGRVEVRAEAAAGGARVRVEVRDTGPGIPRDALAQLFQPFQRLGAERSAVQGVGLGLAVTRRLVERMDGSIGADSEPGAGSCFWIELPAAAAPDAAPSTPAAHGPPPTVSPAAGTLLYVEDNLLNLSLMRRVVALRPGLRLLTATRADQGLRLAAEAHPDLLLLDLDLPDLRGEELLRRLRDDPALAALPVLIVTADSTAPARLPTPASPPILTKPIDVDRLLAALDAALGATSDAPPVYTR